MRFDPVEGDGRVLPQDRLTKHGKETIDSVWHDKALAQWTRRRYRKPDDHRI